MNIKDFERNISSKLLQKGRDYFDLGFVNDLEKVAPGMWCAEVTGTENYTVTVRANRSKINGWECNCPYDYGPICKHVVAVFYALAETLDKPSQKKEKKSAIYQIFEKASKQELEDFIRSVLKGNSGLKSKFTTYFSDFVDEAPEKKHRNHVKQLFRHYSDSYGYIDYRSARGFTNDLFALLEKAEELLEKDNIQESFVICKILIEEVPYFINSWDDSDGGASDIFYSSFELFEKIINQSPPLLKDEAFQYCIKEYSKEKYHGWGFEDNIINILSDLVSSQKQQEQFIGLIDKKIAEFEKNDASDYKVAGLIHTKCNFLESVGLHEQAKDILYQNIKYSEIRKSVVEKKISEKSYKTAIKLCLKGIKIAKAKGHSGTVCQWQEVLLGIAQKEGKNGDIQKWARVLFFEHRHSMEHYKILKCTYSQDEWKLEIEKIVKILYVKNNWGYFANAETLAKIFVEEKYYDRLLGSLQENNQDLSFVKRYASYVQDENPDIIINIYLKGAENRANHTGRNVYEEIVGYLKLASSIKGGKVKAENLAKNLLQKYANRPAMKEVFHERLGI